MPTVVRANLLRVAAIFCLTSLAAGVASAAKAVLVAGGGESASPSPAAKAKLAKPFAVAFDKAGNMYIGEYGGYRVCKVDRDGMLTCIAGTGAKGFSGDGGPAVNGQFNLIHDLTVGPDGNLYVADSDNRRVRKIDLNTGILSTFAGIGPAKISGDGEAADKAGLDGVASLFFDPTGATLYLSGFSKVVRAIDMRTGNIVTVKNLPGGRSIAVDSKGNLYVAVGQTLRVRSPDGKISVLLDKTHDGGSPLPLGNNPKHLAIDAHDNVLICDEEHHRIRAYLPGEGKLVDVAGTGKPGVSGLDGPPNELQLNRPHGVYVHPVTGVIYIADSWNDRVVKIEP